jgi:hypothetical protein
VTDAARKPGTDGVEVRLGEGANVGLGLGRGLGTVAPHAAMRVTPTRLTASNNAWLCHWSLRVPSTPPTAFGAIRAAELPPGPNAPSSAIAIGHLAGCFALRQRRVALTVSVIDPMLRPARWMP